MPKLAFEPHQTGFSLTNALALAEAANLAYLKKTPLRKKVREDWGFETFQFFESKKTDTQAFLAADEEKIIVSFRGTEPDRLGDWLTDLDFWPEKGPFGRVHGGFQESFQSVWKDVSEAIRGLRRPAIDLSAMPLAAMRKNGETIPLNGKKGAARTLWFTGHSLGAALATLAVADLKLRKDDVPVHGLYTFGQPRTGDVEFASAFDAAFEKQTFRFVNNNDLVTRVPTRAMGFSHVGELRYFDAGGDLYDNPLWWDRFLDRIRGGMEDFLEVLKGNLMPDGIEDHNMEKGYIPRIRRALGALAGGRQKKKGKRN